MISRRVLNWFVLFLVGGAAVGLLYYAVKKHKQNASNSATLANPLGAASTDIPFIQSLTANDPLFTTAATNSVAAGTAYDAAQNFGVNTGEGGISSTAPALVYNPSAQTLNASVAATPTNA